MTEIQRRRQKISKKELCPGTRSARNSAPQAKIFRYVCTPRASGYLSTKFRCQRCPKSTFGAAGKTIFDVFARPGTKSARNPRAPQAKFFEMFARLEAKSAQHPRHSAQQAERCSIFLRVLEPKVPEIHFTQRRRRSFSYVCAPRGQTCPKSTSFSAAGEIFSTCLRA